MIPYFLNGFDKLNPYRYEDKSLHQPMSDDDDEVEGHNLTMSNVHAPSDDSMSVEDWSSDDDEGEGDDSSSNMPQLEESDDDLPKTTNAHVIRCLYLY